LITTGVEKDMTDLAALLDRDDVTDNRFKAEYTFVKLACFVEIQRRKAYVTLFLYSPFGL